jgi:hypothetical protein
MSADKQTLILSIGRGDLSSARWDSFTDLLVDIGDTAVRNSLGSQVVFRGEGEGIWEGETEVAYTVIVANFDPTAVIYSGTIDISAYDALTTQVEAIRELFDQDAIAVTLGQTELI